MLSGGKDTKICGFKKIWNFSFYYKFHCTASGWNNSATGLGPFAYYSHAGRMPNGI